MNNIKIVGIGGLPRSGKDSLAELFMENGYYGVSLGDIVREQARERHRDKKDPISVANMTETSNWLRSKYGPDFAMKEAIERYNEASETKEYKGLVAYSIRAPVEADFILNHGGELIWVHADDEVRHQRHEAHMREGEANLTLEEFKAQEDLQAKPQPGLPAEVQMDTTYVKEHSTKVLVNNGKDIEEFRRKAKELIS